MTNNVSNQELAKNLAARCHNAIQGTVLPPPMEILLLLADVRMFLLYGETTNNQLVRTKSSDDAENSAMNAGYGNQVRYLDENGWPNECTDYRKRGLVKDQLYTVRHVSVGHSHTDIYLEGFEGCFNSVCFTLVKNLDQFVEDKENVRNRLRELVDDVWNVATESEQVPHPDWADEIINKWIAKT